MVKFSNGLRRTAAHGMQFERALQRWNGPFKVVRYRDLGGSALPRDRFTLEGLKPPSTDLHAASAGSEQQRRFLPVPFHSMPAERCRTASKRQIPAATETFRLSTDSWSGIETIRSHFSSVRRRRPCSSPPSTMANGSRRSAS